MSMPNLGPLKHKDVPRQRTSSIKSLVKHDNQINKLDGYSTDVGVNAWSNCEHAHGPSAILEHLDLCASTKN